MLQITWLAALMNAAFSAAESLVAKIFLAESQNWG